MHFEQHSAAVEAKTIVLQFYLILSFYIFLFSIVRMYHIPNIGSTRKDGGRQIPRPPIGQKHATSFQTVQILRHILVHVPPRIFGRWVKGIFHTPHKIVDPISRFFARHWKGQASRHDTMMRIVLQTIVLGPRQDVLPQKVLVFTVLYFGFVGGFTIMLSNELLHIRDRPMQSSPEASQYSRKRTGIVGLMIPHQMKGRSRSEPFIDGCLFAPGRSTVGISYQIRRDGGIGGHQKPPRHGIDVGGKTGRQVFGDIDECNVRHLPQSLEFSVRDGMIVIDADLPTGKVLGH